MGGKNFPLTIKSLGVVPFADSWRAMKQFTDARDENTGDEIWFLQHPAVYTLGQSGRREHLLRDTKIPVVQTDRGGQITYHGAGQLVVYLLLDLRRRRLGLRELVRGMEKAVVDTLAEYGAHATGDFFAPGVYVAGEKIAAVGLRVRRGCTYHGLSFNIKMDLSPFADINPCGYPGLRTTQLFAHYAFVETAAVEKQLAVHLQKMLAQKKVIQ